MIETNGRTLGQVWDNWLTVRGVNPQLYAMHQRHGMVDGRNCRDCSNIDCAIEAKGPACGEFIGVGL